MAIRAAYYDENVKELVAGKSGSPAVIQHLALVAHEFGYDLEQWETMQWANANYERASQQYDLPQPKFIGAVAEAIAIAIKSYKDNGTIK